MAKSFGELVVEAREARGWSQSRLAGEVGCSRVQISRIESGERGASLGLFKKLVEVLELDPGAALGVSTTTSESPLEEATSP